MRDEFHRRHHDDEIVDEIHITAQLRYKTSGMSGDEWRVGYGIVIKRKGTVLFSRPYSRLKYVIEHLPWVMATMFEGDLDGFDKAAWNKRVDDDEITCAQVGCSKPATVFYRLKKIFAKNGEGPLPSDLTYVTCFCEEHSTRGDCRREDSDRNYVRISGTPKKPPTSAIRESVFGGVIEASGDLTATGMGIDEAVGRAVRAAKNSKSDARPSLDAPEADKVVEDFVARMLAEPPSRAPREPWLVSECAWGAADVWSQTRGKEFKLVAVRLAGEKETHVGIYVGDLATGAGASFHRPSGVLTLRLGHHNPAILVPSLGRIVYGYESWWGVIKSEADLKQITDRDIENVWYVRALRGQETT